MLPGRKGDSRRRPGRRVHRQRFFDGSGQLRAQRPDKQGLARRRSGRAALCGKRRAADVHAAAAAAAAADVGAGAAGVAAAVFSRRHPPADQPWCCRHACVRAAGADVGAVGADGAADVGVGHSGANIKL